MYLILVYDVEEKRVGKVCKFLRRYLHWVQNSVFEGELTETKVQEMEMGLKEIIDEERDSVIIYKMKIKFSGERTILGVEKLPVDSFL
jgi:CRISPR-associated protein Cas2